MNVPSEIIEDHIDYTSMFDMLSLNKNENCQNIFNSILELIKVDNSETDTIRLVLATVLTDPNKFNELTK